MKRRDILKLLGVTATLPAITASRVVADDVNHDLNPGGVQLNDRQKLILTGSGIGSVILWAKALKLEQSGQTNLFAASMPSSIKTTITVHLTVDENEFLKEPYVYKYFNEDDLMLKMNDSDIWSHAKIDDWRTDGENWQLTFIIYP